MKTRILILILILTSIPLFSQTTTKVDSLQKRIVTLESQVNKTQNDSAVYRKLLLEILKGDGTADDALIKVFYKTKLQEEKIKHINELFKIIKKAEKDEDAIKVLKDYDLRK